MALERPQSAWLDFLDWVKEAPQIVANYDNPGAAGRHLADFAAGPIDALLPGDVIAKQSRPEDYKKLNAIQEIVLNPLTYAAFVPGVGKNLSRAVSKAGSAAYAHSPEMIKRGVDEARRTAGWDDYGAELILGDKKIVPHDMLARIKGIENTSHTAQGRAIEQGIREAGLPSEKEKFLLSDAIRNLDYSGGKYHPEVLVPGWSAQGKDISLRMSEAKRRVSLLAAKEGLPAESVAKLHKLIEFHYPHNEAQLGEVIDRGAMSAGRQQGDYLPSEFMFPGGGNINPAKKRELTTPEAIAGYLKENPDVRLNRDYVGLMMKRGQKQGKMLSRAALREELVGPQNARLLLDKDATTPEAKAAQKALSDAMNAAGRDTDLGHRLKYELEGAIPQGKTADMLRSVNRVFKGAAVYGVGPFMKLGSIVRNQLTAYWQLAGSAEGRAMLMKDPLHGARNIIGALDEGLRANLGFKRLYKDELSTMNEAIEEAAKASKGRVGDMVKHLRTKGFTDAADAIEHNVTQGYVMSEDLARDALTLREHVNPLNWVIPGKSQVANIGASTFNAIEQRMRLGAFVNFKRQFMDKGIPEAEAITKAAKLTVDTLLDYDISGANNRNMRTFFPFAQFVVKSAQQQGRLLLHNPAVIPAVAALYGGDDLPDYARNQAHIGNVLPGMAPTDVFNTMPDFTGSGSFEAFQKSLNPLTNSLHPVLKTAVSMASGVDSFTGRPYMEDARIPFTSGKDRNRTAADTAYGLGKDVGVLQPLTGPVQQAESLGRMDPVAAVLRYATGVNVLTPDSGRIAASSQRSALEADPRVKSMNLLYSKDKDPELQQALKRLAEVQRELKAKADSTAQISAP